MPSPSVVRAATPLDRDEIWRLFELLNDEQYLFPLCKRKINYYFSRFLEPGSIDAEDAGPRGVIGVIGDIGALEGMIVLGLQSYWYSENINLEEYVNFVDPNCRNSNHTKSLIGYAKNIIDDLLPLYPNMRLIVGILSVKRTAAKIRLYGQQMQPVGGYFTWPPIDKVDGEALRRLYKKHRKQNENQKPVTSAAAS
jgi:hypothetical protein